MSILFTVHLVWDFWWPFVLLRLSERHASKFLWHTCSGLLCHRPLLSYLTDVWALWIPLWNIPWYFDVRWV